MSLERAMLIISCDIDVGSPELGAINRGHRDKDVHNHLSESHIGRIEELSVPIFLNLFDAFKMPITIAIRGQLTEIENPTMNMLLASHVKHDLGAHGYSHRKFTNLNNIDAEDELRLIKLGMKKYGITPRTFIFPRNCVAHLNLLEKYNYVTFRGYGNMFRDRMCIKKCAGLYNVNPSMYVDGSSCTLLLKKTLDIAIKNRSPFHIWFHFWNFGENEDSISKTVATTLLPFLNHTKEQVEKGLLTYETMLSAALKVQCFDPSAHRQSDY
jgi:peptidoglycan/xylan/chitin deacetylase (PgdA/CDA1 family)